MNYDIYRYIFLGFGILCGIMLVVSIILFIAFNIPKIISDLSGATARKAIKNIREQNEASGDKSHRVSKVNAERGKLTDKISPSGRIERADPNQMRFGMQTAKISTQQLAPVETSQDTTVLGAANETTVLEAPAAANETTVLSAAAPAAANETTVLAPATETTVLASANETTDLSKFDDGTTLLAQQGETAELEGSVEISGFAIEYDIVMIHTDEIIT